jgi:hypothetical protein
MPKNTVTDPITDQEINFAHLILSGTMNDRQAAETAGLNPETAAYTKSKPRVRDYMIEHRAAVEERLVAEEVEGLRKLNLGRDQIMAQLWKLATLSPEATRGSIAGQVKCISLIVAIEGLIPDRRPAPSQNQPAAPAIRPFYASKWRRKEPQQTDAEQPAETATEPVESQIPNPEPFPHPASKPANDPNQPINQISPSLQPSPLSSRPPRAAVGSAFPSISNQIDPIKPTPLNPFINPQPMSRVPEATGLFEAILDTTPYARRR